MTISFLSSYNQFIRKMRFNLDENAAQTKKPTWKNFDRRKLRPIRFIFIYRLSLPLTLSLSHSSCASTFDPAHGDRHKSGRCIWHRHRIAFAANTSALFNCQSDAIFRLSNAPPQQPCAFRIVREWVREREISKEKKFFSGKRHSAIRSRSSSFINSSR